MPKKYKKSSAKSVSMLSNAGYPDFSRLNNLMHLQAPLAPRFPTFSELVTESVPEKPKRARGLFAELLGSSAETLFGDLLDHPDKYEDGVAELVQQLISGAKKLEELSEQERDLLNRATLDFAHNPPRKQDAELRVAPAPPSPYSDEQEIEMEMPAADAFWWL